MSKCRPRYASRKLRAQTAHAIGLDRAVFVAVPLVLIAVGLAAVYVPALRATRVDPTVALRRL